MGEDPFLSKTMPSDDVPLQMLTMLLELLKSGELPGLAMGGAWFGAYVCLTGYPALCTAALELGLVDICVQHCRVVGSPSDFTTSESANTPCLGYFFRLEIAAYECERAVCAVNEAPCSRSLGAERPADGDVGGGPEACDAEL
jgi:hypothetical protein